jgi:hypothetical protein
MGTGHLRGLPHKKGWSQKSLRITPLPHSYRKQSSVMAPVLPVLSICCPSSFWHRGETRKQMPGPPTQALPFPVCGDSAKPLAIECCHQQVGFLRPIVPSSPGSEPADSEVLPLLSGIAKLTLVHLRPLMSPGKSLPPLLSDPVSRGWDGGGACHKGPLEWAQ